MKLKNKGFEELVSKLEEEGYIVVRNPTDIDTIDPEKSIRIEGWYKELNPHNMDFSVENRALFTKEDAERLAKRIDKTGLPLYIHIHGWKGHRKYCGKVIEDWIYDLEVTPGDLSPEITQITILWNTGEETQVMPPYDGKVVEAFAEEREMIFAGMEYDISREYDEAIAEKKLEECTICKLPKVHMNDEDAINDVCGGHNEEQES